MVFDFAGQNELKKVHAVDAVRVRETKSSSLQTTGLSSSPQNFELTAPAINFVVAQGNRSQARRDRGIGADRHCTGTSSRERKRSPGPQQTVVTAGNFQAEFSDSGGHNHLASVHGAPDARIVNSAPGKPDRVSTSESVDAMFLPEGGFESIKQTGNVAYVDGQDPNKRMQAWANTARYTPADQMLVLTGSPRVAEGGMATTANRIRINRASGEAVAEGDVKSTYSEMKEQPNGALLASSSPIHAHGAEHDRPQQRRSQPFIPVKRAYGRMPM